LKSGKIKGFVRKAKGRNLEVKKAKVGPAINPACEVKGSPLLCVESYVRN